MIKKYNEFLINESNDIEDYDDIVYIFSEMSDDKFELEIEKSFFSEAGESRESENISHNIKGVKIQLRKKIKSILSEDLILNITNTLSECIDKLSELGEIIIKDLSFSYTPYGTLDLSNSNFYVKIHLLQKHKKVEISDNPDFYDFMGDLRVHFRNSNNKVTKSFTIEQGKDFAILVPKEGVNSKSMLSATKSQLKKFFDPYYVSYRNRRNVEFDYDVKLVDDKIHLIYKQKFQVNRWGERVV